MKANKFSADSAELDMSSAFPPGPTYTYNPLAMKIRVRPESPPPPHNFDNEEKFSVKEVEEFSDLHSNQFWNFKELTNFRQF